MAAIEDRRLGSEDREKVVTASQAASAVDPLDLLNDEPLPDIKPRTPTTGLNRQQYFGRTDTFDPAVVAPVVGFAPSFIRRAAGHAGPLTIDEVLALLDLDAFGETFVPRSRVIDFLLEEKHRSHHKTDPSLVANPFLLHHGQVLESLRLLEPGSVQCVVTSTPYWAMRLYEDPSHVAWADGEVCPLGHEQTPEGFVRHTLEVLYRLMPVLTKDSSVWWNVMDTFNTRTQIRGSAVEALRAMQGKDGRSWGEHDCRRYSAGHAFLKDGEQCMIPAQIAERASKLGYFVKTVITWAKTSTLPEPQNSRVSRSLEYILHLSKVRTPKFDKDAYRRLSPKLGGRDPRFERDRLSDVWTIPTSAGGNGHGAQFPLALPGRCISLSTSKGDLVLDPFVGSGSSGVAARKLGCRFIGFDVSETYLVAAARKLSAAESRIDAGLTLFDPEYPEGTLPLPRDRP